MIISAEEFIRLRTSNLPKEQEQASFDTADNLVWLDIIQNFPHYKTWVVHNKTVPIEILEILAQDEEAKVRAEVARKRKINDKIFDLLSVDKDESVRHTLICNTKLSKDKKMLINVEGSQWLKIALEEQLSRKE
jgi:hypothetical protein